MKPHVRVLGIDDSPFEFSDKKTLVVGVVMRLPTYVEGVMKTECEVDGEDANQALAEMVCRSRFRENLKLAMVDGIALGGFNVVDISFLYETTGVPFATVTRDPPDMEAIEKALRIHFDDWERRLEVIRRHPVLEFSTDHKPIFVTLAGIEEGEARSLIRGCTIRGALPEPIRVAHLIATAMARGESKGRA